MPTITRRSVRFKPRRRTKKRTYRKSYKKKHISQYNWGSLRTIGMPLNLVTYIRFSSLARTFNLPVLAPTAPFQSGTTNSYVMGLNMITPWNMNRTTNVPVADLLFFGSDPTPSNFDAQPPASSQTTWSGITWWANWFHKMRITHVTYKIELRPVNDAPTGGTSNSNNNPLIVTVIDSKYIPGIMTPELLNDQGSDDLQSSKSAKSYLMSGERGRPLVIKRRVSIKKLLGCTNLNDVQESECVINPTMTAVDLANRLVRNPATVNQCFAYIRVRRPAAEEGTGIPMRYTIHASAVCKVQLYQQKLNNPLSVTGGGTEEDPGESGSSQT